MSDYKTSTGKSIKQAFIEFHEENPEVFTQFKKYLRDIVMAEMKRKKFLLMDSVKEDKKLRTSSKMILNRIRWEIATAGLKGTGSEENAANHKFDAFKINDAFTSRYARLFCNQNPEWAFLFNLRELRS